MPISVHGGDFEQGLAVLGSPVLITRFQPSQCRARRRSGMMTSKVCPITWAAIHPKRRLAGAVPERDRAGGVRNENGVRKLTHEVGQPLVRDVRLG